MAITLEVRTCRLGEGTKRVKNPFDIFGASEIEAPDDGCLTSEEKSSVKAVLAMIAGPQPPVEYIDWSTELDDGGIVEVWATGLDDDSIVNVVSIVIWRRSPIVSALLFELSQRANLAIVTEVEGIGPWVTSDEQLHAVKARWPAARVVSTPAELGKHIARSRDEIDMDM